MMTYLDKEKYHLLLIGPIHDDGNYERLAKELGVNNVSFLGWRNDIPQLLKITDIYVASSIREGLGLNLIEAQYSQVPVIASINRGHNEVIEDGVNGYLVHHKDAKLYATRVEELASNKELRNKFVSNANITSDKFSKEESMQVIEKLYDSLM